MDTRSVLMENPEAAQIALSLKIPDAIKLIRKIIDRYMDVADDDKVKWTYWVLAASVHASFPTFPYMYLNAMRGSGKSRLLKLTSFLLDGLYTCTPTEAVLFRTADPLMIDEAESISKKEKAALREVMNAAYKRGLRIRRVKKVEQSGDYKVEEFDVFRPMMMANIDGMDDVLEDRCLKMVLERSVSDTITRRLELFEFDQDCAIIRSFLRLMSKGSVGSVVSDSVKNVLCHLFNVLNDTTLHTLTYTTTIHTHTDTTDNVMDIEDVAKKSGILVEKLLKSRLIGRDFEIWMPSLIISALYSDDLETVVRIGETEADGRMKNSGMENRDLSFISFLADHIRDEQYRKGQWISATDITQQYLMANPDDKWFTSEWVGRAVGRNLVVMDRRRLSRGREYMLHTERIISKALSLGLIEPDKKVELQEELK